MKWSEIVAPSLTLLENGFPFGSTAAAVRNLEPVIRRFPETEKHLMPQGRLPTGGRHLAPAGYGEVVDTCMCEAGWRDFYDGEIGRKIADHVGSTGGALTREDMAGFHAAYNRAV